MYREYSPNNERLAAKSIFDSHTTKEGKEILVSNMEDSHLYTTINMYCSILDQCTSIINHKESTSTTKTIAGTMTPSVDTKELVEKAERKIRNVMLVLPVYCMEALRRGPEFVSSVSTRLLATLPKEEEDPNPSSSDTFLALLEEQDLETERSTIYKYKDYKDYIDLDQISF